MLFLPGDVPLVTATELEVVLEGFQAAVLSNLLPPTSSVLDLPRV